MFNCCSSIELGTKLTPLNVRKNKLIHKRLGLRFSHIHSLLLTSVQNVVLSVSILYFSDEDLKNHCLQTKHGGPSVVLFVDKLIQTLNTHVVSIFQNVAFYSYATSVTFFSKCVAVFARNRCRRFLAPIIIKQQVHFFGKNG